jgi:hypothetical protein
MKPDRALLLVALALFAASCAQKMPDPRNPSRQISPGDTVTMNLVPIQDVLARQTPSLMTIKGVSGTGEGKADGKPIIVVYTSHISREDRIAIPAKIEGYEVEVREIGDVTAPPK